MKRFILLILCAALVFSAYSCSDEAEETSLENILKYYRERGMTSWWDILAVYNADENPLDYPGFDEILDSLEKENNNMSRAAYVLVTNISVIIGADEGYFEQYNNYKRRLKNLLENPDGSNINEYIFAYYAIKTSGEDFDEESVRKYFEAAQKADGGFAVSGDVGDIDTAALALPALMLMDFPYFDPTSNAYFDRDAVPADFAANFLRANIKEDNAITISCVISALTGYASDYDSTVKELQESLSLFERFGGYSILRGGARDIIATAQGAIALEDLKNNTNVWHKFYLESLDTFEDYEYDYETEYETEYEDEDGE